MNAKQALTEAAMAARFGQFRVSVHFRRDRRSRNASRFDLACAMMSATAAAEQEHNLKWLLSGGVDEEGVTLNVVVLFEDGVFVVTAFGD